MSLSANLPLEEILTSSPSNSTMAVKIKDKTKLAAVFPTKKSNQIKVCYFNPHVSRSC